VRVDYNGTRDGTLVREYFSRDGFVYVFCEENPLPREFCSTVYRELHSIDEPLEVRPDDELVNIVNAEIDKWMQSKYYH
jgi:hypothetical protein